MLSIRFVRKGKKHHPIYRVIVQEKGRNPQSDYLENLGTYDPHTKEKNINKERVEYWLGKGAQPTETAHNLLVDSEIIKKDKVRAGKSQPGKKKSAEIAIKKAEEEAAKKAAEAEKKATAEAEAAAKEAVATEAPVETAPVE